MIGLEELQRALDYVDSRLESPRGCNGRPRLIREYLDNIGRPGELDAYLELGRGNCDCVLMMNYEPLFEPDGDVHACGHPAIVTTAQVHQRSVN